jgi:hypothetical protein
MKYIAHRHVLPIVKCICRSLAGNMEQNGAEVEILQKKLPQIL